MTTADAQILFDFIHTKGLILFISGVGIGCILRVFKY